MSDVQATAEVISLKREHPALQNMKFVLLFLFLRVLIAFLDQNTVDQNKGKSMRS